MSPLKEFANFITQNKATLTETYAQRLAERATYDDVPIESRIAAGRRVLNRVIEAYESANHDPLTALFIGDNGQPQRWADAVEPVQPMIEVECLGQALNPVITNLEAGKFLWQMLADVRQAIFQASPTAPPNLPGVAPEPAAQQDTPGATPSPVTERATEAEMLLYVRNRAIEATIDPISIADARQPDFPLIYVNPAFEKVTGYSADEILGKNCRFLQSDDREQPGLAEIRTALSEGRSCTVTLRNYRKDGRLFWNELQLSPVYDDQGVLTHFIGVQNDITEQKEIRDALAKLATELETVARVSAAVSTILDPDELLQRVVDLTKERFGLYHVHIYLFDESEQLLKSVAGAGHVGGKMVGPDWHIPLGQEGTLVAQVARSRQGQIVNNIHDISNFYPHPHLPDTQSEMAVPLTISDKLWGVLDIQSDVANAFTDEDMHVHTTLATEIAVALENAHAYEEIEREHAQVEALAKQLDDIRFALDQHSIVAITDQDGIITYVNDKFCEVSKYTRDELLGQDHRIVNSGHHPKSFIRELWETITNGHVWQDEIKNKAKDGTFYWVDTTIVPISNEQGQIIQYVAIHTDVTQSKAHLDQIEAQAERLDQLSRLAVALSQVTSEKEAFTTTAHHTTGIMGADRVSVALFDEVSDQLEIFALDGLKGAVPTGVKLPIAGTQVGRTFNEQQLINTPDLGGSGYLENEMLAAQGLNSSMSTPLIAGGATLGTFNIASKSFAAYTTQSERIVQQIALLLSTTIEGRRYLTQIQHRATQLETVAEVSVKTATILRSDQLLQDFVDSTKERFGLYHAHIYLLNEAGDTLELAAGAGEAGRQMVTGGWRIRLEREHSLVAQAARQREGVIANDVRAHPDFYPNPLLPETRSEMALPVSVGDKLLGVLDVQSAQVNHFTAQDVQVMTILGSQAAVALDNVRLFEQTQQRVRQEQAIREITDKLQAAPTLEVLLETAARELGQRLGARHTVLELGIEPQQENAEG